jgi:hypothetical protein
MCPFVCLDKYPHDFSKGEYVIILKNLNIV